MPYRAGLTPANDISVAFMASLKAGLVGACFVALCIGVSFGLPLIADTGYETSRSVGNAIALTVFAFAAALLVGTLWAAFLLTVVGLPIAHLASKHLETGTGSLIALSSAVILSAMVALLTGGPEAIFIVLPFSIPAAIFFRSDILLERELG